MKYLFFSLMFSIIGVLFSSASYAVSNGCVFSKGDSMYIYKKVALQKNGKNCSRKTCNNKNTNYLKKCTKYVHTDSFCYRNNKGKVIKRNVGLHQGTDEGGKSNNHYWDSLKSGVRISGGKGKTVHMYDKRNCKGAWLGKFKL